MINNGNRTEWSPIRSVIVAVTKEITLSYCTITVKPRYNEEPRDLQTLLAMTKFCYIEVLYIFYFTITKEKKIVRYTKNLIKYRRLHLSAYT